MGWSRRAEAPTVQVCGARAVVLDAPRADAAMRAAMAGGTAWPSYGRDYSDQRWSPLTEITTDNVARLAPAWIYQTGIVAGFETSPVVDDGVMYVSTPRNHMVALGLVFLNGGNAAPDVDGRVRPGDTLFSDCIVAIDVKTGTYCWHYQEVSHDLWDYDPMSPVVRVDGRDSNGRAVPAVAEAGTTGWGSDWLPPAYSPQTRHLYVDGTDFPQLYRRQHEELQPPAQYWGGVVTALHAVDLAQPAQRRPAARPTSATAMRHHHPATGGAPGRRNLLR